MILGGIDIGSNAVRLLIARVTKQDETGQISVKKVKLYRVPVRLGLDAFTDKVISEKLITKLVEAMTAFKLIMNVYEVTSYEACATSALREATNAKKIIERVKKACGIDIKIINGNTEAKLILSNKLTDSNIIDSRFNHLYVDVGGGSTEMSLLNAQGISRSKSFKIGTLRLLQKQVPQETWEAMSQWLHQYIKPKKPLTIIGSGGNINRVFKRSHNHYGQPLMYEYLLQERNLLAALTVAERVNLQDLNKDRAEVIVPALDIFLFVMRETRIQQVVVPKIGVADGLVRKLFQEYALIKP